MWIHYPISAMSPSSLDMPLRIVILAYVKKLDENSTLKHQPAVV